LRVNLGPRVLEREGGVWTIAGPQGQSTT
jgi:hypothetical protein